MTENNSKGLYTYDFFANQQKGSSESAEIIIPLLIDLVNPTSVVDIGCGVGTWLSVFQKKGVINVIGLDGDYINRSQLQINKDLFIPTDITEKVTVNRKFDLALCLEVAEHIPTKESERLIKELTNLADVVFFSAAIPYQTGTGHINEQWQEYWAKLFEENGFIGSDIIRKHIWGNKNIKFWYRQNCVLYVNKEKLPKFKNLHASDFPPNAYFSVVHPELFLSVSDSKRITIGRYIKLIMGIIYLPKKIFSKIFTRM